MPSDTRTPPAPLGPQQLAQWSVLVVLAVAGPWLNPVSWGPIPEMVQRLLSLGCAALLLVALVGWAPVIAPRTLAHAIAGGWLLAALLSAVLGLLQYFGATGALPDGWANVTTVGQAYANLRQRNQFASLTSLGLVALLYLAAEHAHGPQLRWRQAGMVLALELLALGNATSSSRTGALQWMAMVVMAWFWTRQTPARRGLLRWSLLALALYLAATWLLPWLLQSSTGAAPGNVLERFQEQTGCESRAILWANVLQLIAQKPWLGWGWGELKFAHFITPYSGERFCAILDNAHNLPLHLAVELGVPLALLLCGALLAALWHAKPWRDTAPARQMAWAALALLGLHSLLEYPLWYGPFQMAVALCLWLLWRTRSAAHPPATDVTLRMAASSAVATCMLVVMAYTAWDYWRISQLFVPLPLRAEAYREHTADKVSDTWLFRNIVLFAKVTTTTPDSDNAAQLYGQALQLLHYSPEPRVIGPLLESARLAGQESVVTERIRARWRAVYAADY